MNANEYRNNPGQWQASSHPELAERKPEELFVPEFAERYKLLHNDIWLRIIRIHGSLYSLEKLDQFQFDYIYGPYNMEFWHLVLDNFFDIAILLLDGLLNDSGPHVYTLRMFKNDIMRAHWLEINKREMLQQTLRERKFNDEIVKISKMVSIIRNNFIAHQLIDKQKCNPNEVPAEMNIKELRKLFNATHSLFGAISFGSSYSTLSIDMMPGTIGGQLRRSCLDTVLDAVLKDSEFVNKPERRGQWWPIDRECMDAERIRIMNELRKRIGLPEA